jgi:replicative DNA helicase
MDNLAEYQESIEQHQSNDDSFVEEITGSAVAESARKGGRVPPHDRSSEMAVIGGILLDNESVNTALELLRPEDFYIRAHQVIFQAMMDLSERLEPIDAVTLGAELKKLKTIEAAGGLEYVSQVLDSTPTAANVAYYSRIVRALSLRRKVIHEVTEIAGSAYSVSGEIDAFIDEVESRIFKIAESRINPSFAKMSELVKGSIKEVERLYANQGQLSGVSSGFTQLDNLTSGLQPSDLIIIAGRPAMGKTSLVLSMARHIGLDSKRPVAVFSLEMSKEQIVMRMLCAEARVSNSKVRSGKLADTDFPRLVDAASKLAQADIFVDDTPAISVIEMRAKARRLHREKPLACIIVDYLQLMRGGSRKVERREQEISEISGALKALAKELSVPVIALSQLNRSVEGRQDKRPMMADLRESGAIEQDADIIGFVYRDEVYNPDTTEKGVAELIISKHRSGPVGTVRLSFQGEFTVFENLVEGPQFDYLSQDLALGQDEEFI